MSGGVFLRRGEDLVEMVEQPYELEDDLQELIERHPNLLAGDQVNPNRARRRRRPPRRWMRLVYRRKTRWQRDSELTHRRLDQIGEENVGSVRLDSRHS